MGPIEDAARTPEPRAPIVGYWHVREVYCPRCVPYFASTLPHIYEPIRADAQPGRALACCRCGRVVAEASGRGKS